MSLFPLSTDQCLRVVAVACAVKANNTGAGIVFDAKTIYKYLKEGT